VLQKSNFKFSETIHNSPHGLLELYEVPFPLRSQFLPGIGSIMTRFIHSAEVRYFSHKRPWPFCQITPQLV